jgi:hypothetical protein
MMSTLDLQLAAQPLEEWLPTDSQRLLRAVVGTRDEPI